MVDTIVAIATAAGKGGIGVVRVSGPAASSIALQICNKPLVARRAVFCGFVDADNQILDQGIALLFKGPHSFTGEDVLELQAHGGPIILQCLLNAVLSFNPAVRLAKPGEFTERAFLNDKLDLAQAEAVADLIDAQTEQAARLATRSLQGEFSTQVHGLVEGVTKLRMLVEATLDFPEEEIDFLEAADARGQLTRLIEQLRQLLSGAQQGALLRSGLNVVLVGAPNVGKSSLLNALAGVDVAIVTPIAGTTRDKVVQAITLEGIALNIIDTAGLRETSDAVEVIGIARTWAEVEKADIVLHLQDASQTQQHQNQSDLIKQLRLRIARQVPMLTVMNKIDLISTNDPALAHLNAGCVWLSAREGLGLDLLKSEVLRLAGWQASGDNIVLARERQLVAMRKALGSLELAANRAKLGNQQLDLMAEELRLCQLQLSSITGAFSADDLLGEIFSRFCIGK